jgi:cell division control protein 7
MSQRTTDATQTATLRRSRAKVEAEYSDSSSDDIDDSEGDEEAEESVVEDMRKLDESFEGISLRYKLVNRIGEGTSSCFTCGLLSIRS